MLKITYGKKILSIIMALVLVFSCAAITASASGNNVNVEFSLYNKGFQIGAMKLVVKDGTAEEYGFTVSTKDKDDKPIDYVTVFDAIVAAHKEYYGDAFTKDTASDYITLRNGKLSKVFGKSTDFGFSVNGKTPNDGVYNTLRNSYTSYDVDEAQIKDSDRVMGWFFSDTLAKTDINTAFGNNSADAVIGEGEKFTVTGMSLNSFGCSSEEVQKASTFAMDGVTVQLTKDFKEFTDVGTVDSKGNITVNFTQEGKYYLVTGGTYKNLVGVKIPVIGNYCEVEVSRSDKCLWMINALKVKFVENSETDGDIVITVGLTDLLHHAEDKTDVKYININYAFIVDFVNAVKGLFNQK